MLASVVVVTARDPERLSRCLAAVAAGAGDVEHEVLVVLNAADDGLAEAAAPYARLVSSEVPLGFAGGANLGAAQSRGDLIALLHDDAVPEPGWLSALVAALDRNPRAGCAGSLLLDPTGAVQAAGGVLWQDGLTSPLLTAPAEDGVNDRVVDYCSSASVVVRRDAWAAIGGLDEELHPAQYVDVDLALSLRSRGHLTVCAPASVVRHARGGSSTSRQKAFAHDRNRDRLLVRWGAEIAGQAERGDDPESFARAAARTARRTAEVLAMEPVLAEDPAPAPVDVRRALEREVRFLQAYADHLTDRLDRAERIETEVARMHAEIDRLHEAFRVERAARLALEERMSG